MTYGSCVQIFGSIKPRQVCKFIFGNVWMFMHLKKLSAPCRSTPSVLKSWKIHLCAFNFFAWWDRESGDFTEERSHTLIDSATITTNIKRKFLKNSSIFACFVLEVGDFGILSD